MARVVYGVQPVREAIRVHGEKMERVLVEMVRPREALPLLQQWTDEEPESDEAWSLAAHAFHHRFAIDLAAQGGRDFGEGFVLADVLFVERQMVRGDGACRRLSALARARDGIERGGAGHLSKVIARVR